MAKTGRADGDKQEKKHRDWRGGRCPPTRWGVKTRTQWGGGIKIEAGKGPRGSLAAKAVGRGGRNNVVVCCSTNIGMHECVR